MELSESSAPAELRHVVLFASNVPKTVLFPGMSIPLPISLVQLSTTTSSKAFEPRKVSILPGVFCFFQEDAVD